MQCEAVWSECSEDTRHVPESCRILQGFGGGRVEVGEHLEISNLP